MDLSKSANTPAHISKQNNSYLPIIPESYIHSGIADDHDSERNDQSNDKVMWRVVVLPQIRTKQPVSGQTDSILDHCCNRDKQQHTDSKHPCEQEHGRQTSSHFIYVVVQRFCDGEVAVYGHECHVVCGDVQYHHRTDLTKKQLTYDRVDEVQFGRHLFEHRNAAGDQIDR